MANSDFEPIIPITRQDADTAFILLSGNGVVFSNPVPDDWYRVSSSPVDMPAENHNGIMERLVYLPSEPASPLGCAIQHQFCKAALGNSGCGPLSSLRDAVAGAASFFDTDYFEFGADWLNGTARSETAGMNYFFWTFFGFNKSIHEVFLKLGSAALLSQRTLISSIQGPLPPDQWKQDITHAWNISLALMQGSIIDAAYGPTDPDYLQSWVKFTSPFLKKLCNNQVRIHLTDFSSLINKLTDPFQKILSTSHGSFSLAGLCSLFTTGLLITTISYLLEPISSYLCKKGHCQYAHLEWTTNTVLQLQRLAHEELGVGTWSQCADDIPDTKAAEVMASLNITNIQHPTLCVPEKQDTTEPDHVPSSPEGPQDSTASAAAAGSEEPTSWAPASSDMPDTSPSEILVPQEEQPTISNHEGANMEGQHVDEPVDQEAEVGTGGMRQEDGPALLFHNTNTETERIPRSKNLTIAPGGDEDHEQVQSHVSGPEMCGWA